MGVWEEELVGEYETQAVMIALPDGMGCKREGSCKARKLRTRNQHCVRTQLVLRNYGARGVERVERCVDSFELVGVTNNKFEVLYAGVVGHFPGDVTRPPSMDRFLVIQIWASPREGKIISEHARILEYRVPTLNKRNHFN